MDICVHNIHMEEFQPHLMANGEDRSDRKVCQGNFVKIEDCYAFNPVLKDVACNITGAKITLSTKFLAGTQYLIILTKYVAKRKLHSMGMLAMYQLIHILLILVLAT